jgi:hypothetical protein
MSRPFESCSLFLRPPGPFFPFPSVAYLLGKYSRHHQIQYTSNIRSDSHNLCNHALISTNPSCPSNKSASMVVDIEGKPPFPITCLACTSCYRWDTPPLPTYLGRQGSSSGLVRTKFFCARSHPAVATSQNPRYPT